MRWIVPVAATLLVLAGVGWAGPAGAAVLTTCEGRVATIGRDIVQGGSGADVCTAEIARCAQTTAWPISIAFPASGLVAGQDDPVVVTVTNPTSTPVNATLTVTFTAGLVSDQQVSDQPWFCAASPTSPQVQCTQAGFTGTSFVRFDTQVGVPAGTPGTVQACLAVPTFPGSSCVIGRTTVLG